MEERERASLRAPAVVNNYYHFIVKKKSFPKQEIVLSSYTSFSSHSFSFSLRYHSLSLSSLVSLFFFVYPQGSVCLYIHCLWNPMAPFSGQGQSTLYMCVRVDKKAGIRCVCNQYTYTQLYYARRQPHHPPHTRNVGAVQVDKLATSEPKCACVGERDSTGRRRRSPIFLSRAYCQFSQQFSAWVTLVVFKSVFLLLTQGRVRAILVEFLLEKKKNQKVKKKENLQCKKMK